jgi:dihydrofolate reductase
LRKVILFIGSSLDGYIAREDGTIDRLFTDGDYGYKQFYGSVDTVLLGGNTYDQVLEFTPRSNLVGNLAIHNNYTDHTIIIDVKGKGFQFYTFTFG